MFVIVVRVRRVVVIVRFRTGIKRPAGSTGVQQYNIYLGRLTAEPQDSRSPGVNDDDFYVFEVCVERFERVVGRFFDCLPREPSRFHQ